MADGATGRRRASTLLAAGLVCQVCHFVEELWTGFHERFPAALGLAPWSLTFFVTLNVCWLTIWVWTAVRLRNRSRPFFPVWFFAITAMANGVAHPLLSVREGTYFPGLTTAPLLGVVGIWLFVRLMRITEGGDRRPTWRGVALLAETVMFSVVVPGAVTYWIPKYGLDLWGDVAPATWRARHLLAMLLIVPGLGIYVKCVWEFAARGRGIPAPLDHPKQLVITGLYRYVRNPMYVGVLLVLLGEALIFRSVPFLLYTMAWLLFVHVNVVLYEEPNLTRKFGDAYKDYQADVRRWIPGASYRATAAARAQRAERS